MKIAGKEIPNWMLFAGAGVAGLAILTRPSGTSEDLSKPDPGLLAEEYTQRLSQFQNDIMSFLSDTMAQPDQSGTTPVPVQPPAPVTRPPTPTPVTPPPGPTDSNPTQVFPRDSSMVNWNVHIGEIWPPNVPIDDSGAKVAPTPKPTPVLPISQIKKPVPPPGGDSGGDLYSGMVAKDIGGNVLAIRGLDFTRFVGGE